MSLSPTGPSDDRDLPRDPGSVFKALVSSDRLCQHCFRRLRRLEEFPHETGYANREILAYVEEVLPDGSSAFDILDREYYESVELPERLNTTVGEGSYCTNCGSLDPHRSPDTRSKEDARNHAINLSTTLHELGINHDWMVLVAQVVVAKSNPSTAGDDFECFRRATEKAIEVAPDSR